MPVSSFFSSWSAAVPMHAIDSRFPIICKLAGCCKTSTSFLLMISEISFKATWWIPKLQIPLRFRLDFIWVLEFEFSSLSDWWFVWFVSHMASHIFCTKLSTLDRISMRSRSPKHRQYLWLQPFGSSDHPLWSIWSSLLLQWALTKSTATSSEFYKTEIARISEFCSHKYQSQQPTLCDAWAAIHAFQLLNNIAW